MTYDIYRILNIYHLNTVSILQRQIYLTVMNRIDRLKIEKINK